MSDPIGGTPPVDSNFVSEPGDVITEEMVITTHDGRKFDVTNYVAGTVLYEDIFSNVLKGHLIMLDSSDMINKIPLVGTEYITFSFRTPSFKEVIAKTFQITSLTERTFSATDREQSYILAFMSIEGAISNVTNIYKKFSGTTDAVIKHIFQEYLTIPRFIDGRSGPTKLIVSDEPHGSSVSFVSCAWSPFKAINWVANRSFNSATQHPTWLFYETNGAFRLENLEDLVQNQRNNEIIFANYQYSPGTNTTFEASKSNTIYSKPELLKQYSMIRNIQPFSQYDILKDQDYGFYASKLIVHDMTLKTYMETAFDYYQFYPEGKNSKPFPKDVLRNSDSHIRLRTLSSNLHNDFKNPLYEKWALERNSLMYEFSGLKIEIEVPGRTDIEVGVLVDVTYPKAMDKNEGTPDSEYEDTLMTARYLVTAIKHAFSLNKHMMWLELVRSPNRI